MSCVSDYGGNERHHGSVLVSGNDITLHWCSGLYQGGKQVETELRTCAVAAKEIQTTERREGVERPSFRGLFRPRLK